MASSDRIPNYYKILGVPEYSSAKQIKEAFIILSRRMKRNHNNPPVGKAIRLNADDLLEAYAVLSSKARRQKFDRMLTKQRSATSYKVTTAIYDTTIDEEFENVSYGEKLYRKGLSHLLIGRHQKALKCFRKLLSFEKDNPLVYYNLARAYFMGNANSFARKNIEHAIQFDPTNENFHLLLGKIFERSNKPFAAGKCYAKAYELNPNNPQANVNYDRGSIFIEKIMRAAVRILTHFKPDPHARTLKYKEGLLTKQKVRNFFQNFSTYLRLLPPNQTFRYTGLW